MNTLINWYPGDGAVVTALTALGMIAVIVGVTWVGEQIRARRRAALKSALWLSALIGVLLTPALAAIGPYIPWHVAIVPAEEPRTESIVAAVAPETPMAAAPAIVNAPAAPGSGPEPAPGPAATKAETPPRSALRKPVSGPAPVAATAPPMAVTPNRDAPETNADARINLVHAMIMFGLLAWGLGSAYLAVRLAHGCWRMRGLGLRLRPLDNGRWAADCRAVADALGARLPEICVSADVHSPLVAGVLRPRVILPEGLLEQIGPTQFRAILIHECAHIVRRDPWVRFLQRLAVVFFWLHPLIHVLNRRLDQAREDVCDNYVLAHTAAPEYAETLLTVAQTCYPAARLQGYLAMIPRHHNLESRVADLLEDQRDTATRLPIHQRAALVTSFALLLGALSAFGLERAADAQPDTSPVESKKQDKKAAPEKSPAPAGAGKISGRVVHADDGRPLPAAEVRLIRRGNSYRDGTARTPTNDQGEFTFDGLAPGQYRVLCFHGNLASRSQVFQGDIATVAVDGSSKPLTLKMRPGISVRVKVLSQADGKPLAGARVRLDWTDADRDQFTNAQGELVLQTLTAQTWNIEAAAKGHASRTQVINLGNEHAGTLAFMLPPGGVVEGRVLDEQGKPLARVGVNPYGSEQQGVPLDYVETDAKGHFRFDHLPLGQNLRIMAAKRDYLSEWRDLRIDSGKEPTRLDVVLKKRPHGGAVKGVVSDHQGRPVAGAEVVNIGGSSDHVRRSTTDAQGKFLLDDVYTDGIDHRLSVRAKGFAPQQIGFKPGTAKAPTEVAVTLLPGHKIKGRVVNEAGKPLVGVRIYYAHGDRFPGEGVGGSLTTDADGRFQSDSLPSKCPFTFHKEGYSSVSEVELVLDGPNEVVVGMRSQGLIKGRVIDAASGKPVPRFNVRITFTPDPQPGDPTTSLTSSRLYPGEDVASPKGQFVLKDLMADFPVQIIISAEGYRRHVARRVVARVAGEADEVEFRLQAEDPAKLLMVRGKLVDHRGQPVRGAELRLIVATDRPAQRDTYPFNWQMIETGQIDQAPTVLQVQRQTTTADGAFVFQRVPPGAEIELAYWGKGVPHSRLDRIETLSDKERGALVVKAPAPARIVGTIDRKVFPEFGAIQLSTSSRFYEAKLAADKSSFVLDDLPAGAYELQVYSPFQRVEGRPGALTQSVLGRRSVTLEEGKEQKVELGAGDRAPQ